VCLLVCTGTLSVLKISGRTPEQQCKKEMQQNRICLQSINQEGNGTLQFETFLYSSEIAEIQFIILIGYFLTQTSIIKFNAGEIY
jgi:hypothetical protein